MSRSRSKRVETLKTRATHLHRRIALAAKEGRELSYDKAELSALEWAMPVLEAHIEANRVLHEQLGRERDDSST